jgi:hypothetical protein
MNNYNDLIEELKSAYGSTPSVKKPDWNQSSTSWSRHVPEDFRKIWNEIPYETQLIIYHMAGEAYRRSY